jgi:hypothetical protein
MIYDNSIRILAVAPLTRGFGYAVMEGPDRLLAFGSKAILRNKNARSLLWAEKFIRHYQPAILVLPDVNAADTHRAKRIKSLHQKLGALAREHQLKVKLITATQLRERLLGNRRGTKQAMAETLAAKFPVELASRLPPKRRPWMSEDPRMDIFDAVGLAVVFWPQGKQ